MFTIKLATNVIFPADVVEQQFRTDGVSQYTRLCVECMGPEHDLAWYQEALTAAGALDTVTVYRDEDLALTVTGYTHLESLNMRLTSTGMYLTMSIATPSVPVENSEQQ